MNKKFVYQVGYNKEVNVENVSDRLSRNDGRELTLYAT